MANLTAENKEYWQSYSKREIPSVPVSPPEYLVHKVTGPILDIGTGNGPLAEELSIRGLNVFAVDINKDIIAENMKKATKVNYSVQDITQELNFKNDFFDLLISKFTLTSIHEESWKHLGNEVFRILKPSGNFWVLEPLVSESYKKRYDLASKFIEDKHCVFVFKDKEMANSVDTERKLKIAIEKGQVSRVVKHYEIEELKDIFNKLKLENYREINVPSPSGYNIRTFEGIFSK